MKKADSVWLICDKVRFAKANGFYKRYFDRFNEAGYDVTLLFVEEIVDGGNIFYVNGEQFEPPAIAVMRTYNLALSVALEQKGVKVFNNSQVAEICNDKYKTIEFIRAAGMEVPDTELYSKSDYGSRLTGQAFPAILKSLSGHGGTEVFKVDNKKELDARLEQITENGFILQKPVKTFGRDLRVYVVGEEIVASVLRSNANDFRSNYSLGGEAIIYKLNDYEKKLAKQIIDLFDFGMVGIDFIFEGDRPIFNEIEDVAGARMLYNCTDIDIVKLYVEHIISRSN